MWPMAIATVIAIGSHCRSHGVRRLFGVLRPESAQQHVYNHKHIHQYLLSQQHTSYPTTNNNNNGIRTQQRPLAYRGSAPDPAGGFTPRPPISRASRSVLPSVASTAACRLYHEDLLNVHPPTLRMPPRNEGR